MSDGAALRNVTVDILCVKVRRPRSLRSTSSGAVEGLEDEPDKQETLDMHTLRERMSIVTFLDAAPCTTLDQRPGIVLEEYSKEDAFYP